MKKIILLTAIWLTWASTATAQQLGGRIAIDRVNYSRQGDSVRIDYRLTLSRRAVKRGRTLLFSPFLAADSGHYRQSLPPVVVLGSGSSIAARRGQWVDGLTADAKGAHYFKNGQTASLTTIVPFQEWTWGANLWIDAVEGGCCSYRRLDAALVEGGAYPEQPKPVVVEPAPVRAWVPKTLTDSLSTAFTFVLPASEYDENDPFRIYDDERESALVVYYHTGKYDLVPDYMNNRYTLSNLVNVIRMILQSSDSNVERIVVAGFASPEGGYALNNRLAFDRAVTIKRYLMDRTGIADSRIELFNGSEDWRGLRAMVAKSGLPEKQQVLDIIDHTPVWDSRADTGRQAALMRLNGGRTYRYLLHEYFPYLRSGAFIRVYYENN